MPIKNSKELDIDGDDIQNILNKKLENKNDILKQYILDNKGMWLE